MATLDPQTIALPGSKTGLYVGAVVALSIAGVLAIVVIAVGRPTADNTSLVTMILGFLVPTILGFLGAAIKEVHVAFNSRMTELLALTARSAKAEGQLQGQTHERDRADGAPGQQ